MLVVGLCGHLWWGGLVCEIGVVCWVGPMLVLGSSTRGGEVYAEGPAIVAMQVGRGVVSPGGVAWGMWLRRTRWDMLWIRIRCRFRQKARLTLIPNVSVSRGLIGSLRPMSVKWGRVWSSPLLLAYLGQSWLGRMWIELG